MLPGGGGAQCDISTQIAIGGAHTRNDPSGMGMGMSSLSPALGRVFFWENRKLPISFHCVKWELPSLKIDLRLALCSFVLFLCLLVINSISCALTGRHILYFLVPFPLSCR